MSRNKKNKMSLSEFKTWFAKNGFVEMFPMILQFASVIACSFVPTIVLCYIFNRDNSSALNRLLFSDNLKIVLYIIIFMVFYTIIGFFIQFKMIHYLRVKRKVMWKIGKAGVYFLISFILGLSSIIYPATSLDTDNDTSYCRYRSENEIKNITNGNNNSKTANRLRTYKYLTLKSIYYDNNNNNKYNFWMEDYNTNDAVTKNYYAFSSSNKGSEIHTICIEIKNDKKSFDSIKEEYYPTNIEGKDVKKIKITRNNISNDIKNCNFTIYKYNYKYYTESNINFMEIYFDFSYINSNGNNMYRMYNIRYRGSENKEITYDDIINTAINNGMFETN